MLHGTAAKRKVCSLYNARNPDSGLLMKRLFDLLFAGLLALLLWPVLCLIALLVRRSSPGPALYWSERVGRGNHGSRCRLVLDPRADYASGLCRAGCVDGRGDHYGAPSKWLLCF